MFRVPRLFSCPCHLTFFFLFLPQATEHGSRARNAPRATQKKRTLAESFIAEETSPGNFSQCLREETVSHCVRQVSQFAVLAASLRWSFPFGIAAGGSFDFDGNFHFPRPFSEILCNHPFRGRDGNGLLYFPRCLVMVELLTFWATCSFFTYTEIIWRMRWVRFATWFSTSLRFC